MMEGIKVAQKKSEKLEWGDVTKLGFLQQDDFSRRRKELREDIATLDIFTQSSHIPTANFDAPIH
jgi:hypothetical protein